MISSLYLLFKRGTGFNAKMLNPRNFIIFFVESEGSSALIDTLKNFCMINIVGFEPFDSHVFLEEKNRGYGKDITKKDLIRCLDIIYKPSLSPAYCERLNEIYSQYSNRKLSFNKDVTSSIGLKMRNRKACEEDIFGLLRAHNVVAFILFRRDV